MKAVQKLESLFLGVTLRPAVCVFEFLTGLGGIDIAGSLILICAFWQLVALLYSIDVICKLDDFKFVFGLSTESIIMTLNFGYLLHLTKLRAYRAQVFKRAALLEDDGSIYGVLLRASRVLTLVTFIFVYFESSDSWLPENIRFSIQPMLLFYPIQCLISLHPLYDRRSPITKIRILKMSGIIFSIMCMPVAALHAINYSDQNLYFTAFAVISLILGILALNKVTHLRQLI